MSSFSIYNDENFNNLSSNNVNSSSGNFSGLTAGNANINLLTSGNANINLLTLTPRLTPRLTPNVAGDGALIYDITTNQFKGRINSTWQTLAAEWS
jgi:hypothetical protein